MFALCFRLKYFSVEMMSARKINWNKNNNNLWCSRVSPWQNPKQVSIQFNNNVNVYQNVWIPKIELVSNSQWFRRDDSTVDDCREIWLQLEIDYLEYTLTLTGPVFRAEENTKRKREENNACKYLIEIKCVFRCRRWRWRHLTETTAATTTTGDVIMLRQYILTCTRP